MKRLGHTIFRTILFVKAALAQMVSSAVAMYVCLYVCMYDEYILKVHMYMYINILTSVTYAYRFILVLIHTYIHTSVTSDLCILT